LFQPPRWEKGAHWDQVGRISTIEGTHPLQKQVTLLFFSAKRFLKKGKNHSLSGKVQENDSFRKKLVFTEGL